MHEPSLLLAASGQPGAIGVALASAWSGFSARIMPEHRPGKSRMAFGVSNS